MIVARKWTLIILKSSLPVIEARVSVGKARGMRSHPRNYHTPLPLESLVGELGRDVLAVGGISI